MKHAFVVASILLLASVAASGATKSKATGHADIINAQGDKIGAAKLTETRTGVKIALNVSKLPKGVHGFHIHAVGKCDTPDFKTAGGHFNPEGKKHGLKNPDGPHAGDMQNITVSAKGTARTTITDPRVTLGEGKNSLFQSDGTAIVIHEKADDEMTDPAGNAGNRIACGVIAK